MKKTLLFITILLVLTGILYCEELDMNKIMPKKLVYAELPDDYPKELDELFIFYWDIVQMIARWDCDYGETGTKLQDYISNLAEQKIRKCVYLIWLAGNSIPEYFEEYCKINESNLRFRNPPLPFSWEDIENLSIYPIEQTAPLKFGEYKDFNMRGIDNINIKLFKEFLKYSDINEIPFYSIIWPIWVKVRIIDTENIYEPAIGMPTSYLKVEVIDAFGGEFKHKNIIVNNIMIKHKYEYEIGKEYFMNLNYTIPNLPDAQEIISQKFDIDPQRRFCSSILRSWEINNEKVTEIKTGFSNDIYGNYIQIKENSYNDLKNQFSDCISKMKGGQ